MAGERWVTCPRCGRRIYLHRGRVIVEWAKGAKYIVSTSGTPPVAICRRGHAHPMSDTPPAETT